MKTTTAYLMIPVATIGVLIGGALAFAGAETGVAVESGSAAFRSPTNVAGIEVKGSSNALSAHADIEAGTSLTIRRVEASVPVHSLGTGMKMRDEHMRKYIFTTPSGEIPDLRFVSDGGTCPAAQAREFTCRLSGSLSLRGATKQIALNLKVHEQSGSYRVNGDGIVKLSDFGIVPPVQLGVKVSDDVEIHLDFTGKQTMAVSMAKAGGQ